MPLPARRFLPSMTALSALESIYRLGSVTAAAEELALSQSAVSKQLLTLEAALGVSLASREGNRLRLSPAAQSYAAEIREALARIGQASMRLSVNPTGGSLSLAILPTFGMRWLMPRLPRFAESHPEITIHMGTRLARFNFAAEGFDAAIHYGAADWPGCAHLKLRAETVLPVCAPALLTRHTVARPSDLLGLPLLHIQTRPTAWADWLAHWGVKSAVPHGTLHDQFSTITQAAIHGLGVALLPDYLADAPMARGELVPAWGGATPALGAYWLVWPKEKSQDPALRQFCDWLASEAETEDPLPR
jgi:LysR family transcriptional regulator, glycine cleavage system transcriptional activator